LRTSLDIINLVSKYIKFDSKTNKAALKTAYCTISTRSHLYKASALFESLSFHDDTAERICWCIDGDDSSILNNGTLVFQNEFPTDSRIDSLFHKHSSKKDKLRWSLKPIQIECLLQTYDKVIYLDNDICFFGSPSFIWDELNEYDLLLTPHHYPRDYTDKQNWLEANFKVGLYNAGFLAANKKSVDALRWWAGCCLYRCEKSLIRGLFDDQKYLDFLPIVHPNTKVMEHQGCNVAGWNVDVCRRTAGKSDTVSINDKWPIVFVHFNGFSVRAILDGDDPLLKPYLDEYISLLKDYQPQLQIETLWNENTLWDRLKLFAWKTLNSLKN
jgi:hypothetical protein